MSQLTTNYGFTKPKLTDVPDITVLSQNWEMIDSILKSIDMRNKITIVADSTDANSYATRGIYFLNNASNVPSEGKSGLLFVEPWSDSLATLQFWIERTTHEIYLRVKDYSWSSWSQISTHEYFEEFSTELQTNVQSTLSAFSGRIQDNYDYIDTVATALREQIGNTLVTDTISSSLDTSKAYVYVGTSTPTIDKGDWIYYDGTEWKSGGVYNSEGYQTDKTLTVPDMAADAKVVGDNIADLKSAFNTATLCAVGWNPIIQKGYYIKFVDGSEGASNKYARTALWYGYGQRFAIDLSDSTYEYAISYFDLTGNLSDGTGYLNDHSEYASGLQYIPSKALKFGLSFRRVDQASLSDSDIDAISAALSCYAATIDNTKIKLSKTIEETDNLWVFENTSTRTTAGLTVNFPNDSTIHIEGNITGTPRFSAMGSKNSGERLLLPGTYVVTYEYIKYSNSANGVFKFGYSYDGTNVTFISSKTPFTISSPAYVFLDCTSNIGAYYNQTFKIKLVDISNVEGSMDYTPKDTAVDYKARSMANSRLEVSVYPGAINTNTGSMELPAVRFYEYRVSPFIYINGNDVIQIKINTSDSNLISSFYISEYSESTEDNIAYIGSKTDITFYQNVYKYNPSAGAKYFKITLTLIESNSYKFKPLTISSIYGNKIYKEPNITDGSKIFLKYFVTGDIYTSGQLLLPTNYSIHRKSVPLVVVFHGTNSMNTWNAEIGTSTSGSGYRYLLDYLTDEGFAVFDCYCFTTKYFSNQYQNQAAPIPLFLEAYIEGIKWVCNNYNVDIDNIFAYATSAGGNIAYMVLHSALDIKFKAMALLAPSYSFISTIFRTYFLREEMRTIIVDYLGLQNETNVSDFINTQTGVSDTTARSFVEDHIDSFAGMNCAAMGTHGATYTDIYGWFATGVSTLPQWMVDLSIPSISSGWTTSPALGVPSIINHPELSSYTHIPTKFWQAFDDENVSGHVNYTIYNWLKNGGSNVQWRTMPNGTGGHYAMGTGENALKSSGTTRLGIEYTDIATAFVEMADFFYNNM